MISYRFAITSSLDKVFSGWTPDGRGEPAPSCEPLEAFWGQTVSFQIAYFLDCSGVELLEEETLHFSVQTGCGCEVRLRRVCLMPGRLVCSGEHDDDYLSTQAGLYPDLLDELPCGGVQGVHRQWRCIWVDLTPLPGCPAGIYPVEAAVRDQTGRRLWATPLSLRVLPAQLPPLRLLHTEFLHADCLADYYRAEPFSERHWELLEHYIRYAVQHGVNMILTPLFTPPLDTARGGERTTVQLVGVKKQGERYSFDFSRLDRWIDLCLGCGARCIEMAHLFTQWGADFAPKIMAEVNGAETRLFGWDTPAQSEAYRGFLAAFLPALRAYLAQKGVLQKTWFHVSDEPQEKNLDSYRAARQCMQQYLPDSPLFDACSDYALYAKGAVSRPIVSNNHIAPFLEAKVPGLWTYYCCVQGVDVSNRFFAMPSYRNRIIGVQAYLYKLEGFLHWGYNFYNTRFSRQKIDPYAVTDCGEQFPAGDAFLVYPGADGHPRGSIRLMVLAQAMDDYRALQLLESLSSYEAAAELIRQEAGMQITFAQYPRNKGFLPALRRRVNREIERLLARA